MVIIDDSYLNSRTYIDKNYEKHDARCSLTLGKTYIFEKIYDDKD